MRTPNKPLSNTQIELLKIFSTDLSDQDMRDLKNVLADFYSKKAIKSANDAWTQNKLSNEDMDKLLNSDEQ